MGIHGADRGPGQHVPLRSDRPLWTAKHRGPDHLHQWNQPVRTPSLSLSKLHQGSNSHEFIERMHSLIKIFHPIDHFFTLFVIFTLSCNSVWYADIVVVTSTSVSLYFNCCINELKN